MNISTRQLRAFALVSQHGSFTKAAESMHITQAGLSALIKELEAQVGFRLFERTTRRVALSAAGQRFLPVASQAEHSLALAKQEIESELAGQQRNLRVAASPIMVNGILPFVLKHHLGRHPKDNIELLDVSRSEVLPEVEKGSADIGLGIFFRPVSGIRQYRLFSSSLLLLSPKNWQPVGHHEHDTAGQTIALRSVPAQQLIKLPQDNPFQQWVEDRLLAAHEAPRDEDRCTRLRNIESCIAMVEIGRGHFIAPDFVSPICRRYAVQARAIRSERNSVDFYAIARAGLKLGPVARDFVDSFVKTIASRKIGSEHVKSVDWQ